MLMIISFLIIRMIYKKTFSNVLLYYLLLAAITEKIKIGQIVVCNSYRNPLLLAKMLSTLDIISNGRVELGIGAGWYEQEYLSYGYDFPSDITRIMQLDESISIIKAMWTDNITCFVSRKIL